MEFTTLLELQSQTTRLVNGKSYVTETGCDGAITLLGALFQETFPVLSLTCP